LRGTGFNIDDEWIGSLFLIGLPEKFSSMIMAIEHSGIAYCRLYQNVAIRHGNVDKAGSAFVSKAVRRSIRSIQVQQYKSSK